MQKDQHMRRWAHEHITTGKKIEEIPEVQVLVEELGNNAKAAATGSPNKIPIVPVPVNKNNDDDEATSLGSLRPRFGLSCSSNTATEKLTAHPDVLLHVLIGVHLSQLPTGSQVGMQEQVITNRLVG